MCLSIPGRITEINRDNFVIQYGTKEVKAKNSLVEDVDEGDWVIVENNFITRKLTKEQADEFFKIIKEEEKNEE